MKYLANIEKSGEEGQLLEDHLKGVALRSLEIVESLDFSDKEKEKQIKAVTLVAALMHDIGKCDQSFQEYLRNKAKKDLDKNENTDAEGARSKDKKEEWHGIYHQEISWAYMVGATNFFNSMREDQKMLESASRYAVYWHHPKNPESEKNYFSIFKKSNFDHSFESSEFKDFISRINNILLSEIEKHSLTEYFRKDFFRDEFKELYSSSETDSPEFDKEEYSRYSSKDWESTAICKLSLYILIEADREVSSWGKLGLSRYLSGQKISIDSRENFVSLGEIIDSGERTTKQLDLAERMSKNKFSVAGVDCGAGKTSVALLWKKSLDSKRKTVFALPMQRQIAAMHESVLGDGSRIFGESFNKLEVQASFNGRVQFCNKRDSESVNIGESDINIISFDRFLSPNYNRRQFNEMVGLLRSDIVLDEFHSFIEIPSMIVSLKTILLIRSWINTGKTLFLSGTPDPALIEYLFKGNKEFSKEKNIYSRSELPEVSLSKRLYVYKDERPKIIKNDSLFVTNRVYDAQAEYLINKSEKNSKPSFLIHSKYRDNDLKDKVKDLLSRFGRGSSDTSTIFAAKMLSASYNISRKNAYIGISLPNTVVQYLGRVDRFGDRSGGEVVFYKDPIASKIYTKKSEKNPNSAGWGETYEKFHNYLSRVLEEAVEMTAREANISLYDNFWDVGNIHKAVQELSDYVDIECKRLKAFYPKKILNKLDAALNGSIFRYGGKICTAAEYDDSGSLIGQMVTELVQENSVNILKLGKEFILKLRDKELKDIGRVNGVAVFNYLENKRSLEWMLGSFDVTPIVLSSSNKSFNKRIKAKLDEEMNKKKTKKQILEESHSKTNHRVYNKDLGLISSQFLYDDGFRFFEEK